MGNELSMNILYTAPFSSPIKTSSLLGAPPCYETTVIGDSNDQVRSISPLKLKAINFCPAPTKTFDETN
jgi:hypothetical protein